MKTSSPEKLNAVWSRHHDELRDPAQIISQWQEAAETDPQLLRYTVRGDWWEILASCRVTLLVTREYEHLVMAMHVTETGPVVSYIRMPHPSGLAVDRYNGIVYIASTRNPNQVYDLMPVSSMEPRLDVKIELPKYHPLVPIRSRFFPGCLYIHDLSLIKGSLYANAVGQNAVVRLYDDGRYRRVWWPMCIETDKGPIFGQNHIQLSSIAAGTDLTTSYFSASADKLSTRRPGHKNFPVDKRGVIFSGATREPVVRGLTRPHSARLHNGQVWVDNSGYGELGIADNGRFRPVVRLPGWTRGLCFCKQIAFVGTSRVIPRFRQYAPGLEVDNSLCGLHVVDTESGKVLGSLIWPYGNQIFAIDLVSNKFASGFPFIVGAKRTLAYDRKLFYAFSTGR
jgi:uncharacterized protein (TIGR03032 family)